MSGDFLGVSACWPWSWPRSGIDTALTLAVRIAGDDVAQAIQLGIECDPQPPFSAGSPAPAYIVEGVRARMERAAAAALSRSGSA